MKRQDGEPSARTTVSRMYLSTSRALMAALFSLAVVFGTTSCAKAPTKPPESALKQAKKDSRLEQREEPDLERRHLAPPPAYGNKVVMAEQVSAEGCQF